ncbi:unnamed protein product [Dimorphilus gyrociliatus]|uniref:Uncharacterized protein n=1 Tax=Dimorphilus gyrociliatus TaxID=2664684 RepID=A0A7I8W7U4_9ANNE|nr:unnamed protein product [Dimorphilus gyrociliatus]
MTDKPTLPRPPTVNVLPAEDERDEGACDLEDNNTLKERAESSASIAGTNVNEDLDKESSVFRRFGTQSRINLEQKVLEWEEEEKERKNQHEEGRLVDGELKFGNDEGSKDPPPERDLALFEGNPLPDQYGNLFPEDGYGVPMEEIDPYLHYKASLLIIYIYPYRSMALKFHFSLTKPLI